MAAYKGAQLGLCSVTQLDTLYTNHSVFENLCSESSCKECVATPEDMDVFSPDSDAEQEANITNDGGNWEIPF